LRFKHHVTKVYLQYNVDQINQFCILQGIAVTLFICGEQSYKHLC